MVKLWGSAVTQSWIVRGLLSVLLPLSDMCVHAKLLQSCLTLQLHGLQPARLLCPWDAPGRNTGVDTLVFVESGLWHQSQGHHCHNCHQKQPYIHFPEAKRDFLTLTFTVFSKYMEEERSFTLFCSGKNWHLSSYWICFSGFHACCWRFGVLRGIRQEPQSIRVSAWCTCFWFKKVTFYLLNALHELSLIILVWCRVGITDVLYVKKLRQVETVTYPGLMDKLRPGLGSRFVHGVTELDMTEQVTHIHIHTLKHLCHWIRFLLCP